MVNQNILCQLPCGGSFLCKLLDGSCQCNIRLSGRRGRALHSLMRESVERDLAECEDAMKTATEYLYHWKICLADRVCMKPQESKELHSE